jgi:asparagine synthetase B (glutamine-hydrolysing)
VFPADLNEVFPWRNFYDGTQRMYLLKEEHVAGMFGIEARYPFLDKRLVQEFLHLSHKLKNAKYKSVLHEYLSKYNYPVFEKRKIGFSAGKNLR